MHREFELVSIALRRNEVSEARARTNALLRLHPRHPNADLLNGVVARAEGNLTGSFEILSELHRRLPLEPAPLIQLASTLNAMGKLDEAIAAYQQVLQQRPTHPDAAFGLGLALKKSQPWRAGPYFLRAARCQPERVEALHQALRCAMDAVLRGEPLPTVNVPLPEGGCDTQLVSVICCSVDPARLSRLRENLATRLENWELVHIGDARSLAEAYNRGLERAVGEIIVLCHDDIRILAPDFSSRLRDHLSRFDIIGVAGSSRCQGPAALWSGPPDSHGWITYREGNTYLPTIAGAYGPVVAPAQVLDGVFIAANRNVFSSVRFDETAFDGFHLYDIDFTWRAHTSGLRLAICQDLLVEHLSRGDFGSTWQTYAARFRNKFPELVIVPPTSGPNTFEVAVHTEDNVRAVYAWMSAWLDELGHGEGFPGAMEGRARG